MSFEHAVRGFLESPERTHTFKRDMGTWPLFTAVVKCEPKKFPPLRPSPGMVIYKLSALKSAHIGSSHVKSSVRVRDSMLSVPVRHDISLEAELRLEDSVQGV